MKEMVVGSLKTCKPGETCGKTNKIFITQFQLLPTKHEETPRNCHFLTAKVEIGHD